MFPLFGAIRWRIRCSSSQSLTNAVQIPLVRAAEVQDVPDGLGQADADVERVDHGLSEVLLCGALLEGRQVHPVETVLVPDGGGGRSQAVGKRVELNRSEISDRCPSF